MMMTLTTDLCGALLLTMAILTGPCSSSQRMLSPEEAGRMHTLCPQNRTQAEVPTPDQCDVTGFVMCYNGRAVAIGRCGDQLHFNPETFVCGREKVQRPDNCPEPSSMEPCSDPTAQSDANNDTCKRYYACTAAGPVEMLCPLPSYYIASRGRCIYLMDAFRGEIPPQKFIECFQKDAYTEEELQRFAINL